MEKLCKLIAETTSIYRHGEVVEERDGATHINMMPHKNVVPTDEETRDMVFLVVGVKQNLADEKREEIVEALKEYPEPERLAGGPSYIESGAHLGSQEMALRLYALGDVIGLWRLILPRTLGITGEQERAFAGNGMILFEGYSNGAPVNLNREVNM